MEQNRLVRTTTLFLHQLPRNLFVQNVFDRQGADHDAGAFEEGADLFEGVFGIVEGHEETGRPFHPGDARSAKQAARHGRFHAVLVRTCCFRH